MTAPYKVGQRIELESEGHLIRAKVETHWHDKKNSMHRLVVTDDAGLVHIARIPDAAAGLQVATVSTVDLVSADVIARRHLAGERLPMGVEAQLNVLAAAYLQLRGGCS